MPVEKGRALKCKKKQVTDEAKSSINRTLWKLDEGQGLSPKK